MSAGFLASSILEQEKEQFIALQEMLLTMTGNILEPEVAEAIWETGYPRSLPRFRLLINVMFVLVEYRPTCCAVFSQVLAYLTGRAAEAVHLYELKPLLIERIAKPYGLSNARSLFIIHCMKVGLLDENDLFDSFKAYYELDCRVPTQWMWFLSWVAPVIDKIDQDLFNDCVRQYVAVFKHAFADKKFEQFACQFEELKKRNWVDVEELGFGATTDIGRAITRDDDDEFRQCQKRDGVDFESRIPSSVIDVNDILQDGPTLVQAAVFYGTKCFEYMKSVKAPIKKTDLAERTTAQFAIAGGHMEAIEGLGLGFEGGMHVAALYHRHDVFDYFVKLGRFSPAEVIKPYGNVVHACAASDNARDLLICFQLGVNINARDHDGVCFFLIVLHFMLQCNEGIRLLWRCCLRILI